MNVSIIIPTYNEKENIVILTNKLIEIFKNSPHDLKIIVVDDNSPDGTSSVVRNLDLFEKSIFLITRSGKLGVNQKYLNYLIKRLSIESSEYWAIISGINNSVDEVIAWSGLINKLKSFYDERIIALRKYGWFDVLEVENESVNLTV